MTRDAAALAGGQAKTVEGLDALLCRVGEARFLLPLGRVERVYPMVLPSRDAHGGWQVHLRGETLPLLDVRDRWRERAVTPAPSQRMVVLHAPRREAWWVDDVEGLQTLTGRADSAVHAGQVLPVLWGDA
ncbi:chemotaxis protein CheW [Deinococcus aquiradiocola]|uniref:CheW-like domain-containing protein n=1 Tax=Deinococcus aquiradiocola TaxID=393059 RepID=A0A917PG34_9DEIO|nr:chemotaxis protein CheW [Deinococcus aquiradiocola]GGJ76075.1 hypothetical protein GCM10008939_20320 [Deinococcus aquiradiocola]